MPTPPEPNGRSSSAKNAAPVPASSHGPTDGTAPRPGSTGSHQQSNSPSDLVPLGGDSTKRSSVESDIAQFLAHPNGPAANSDDAPTVITKNQNGGLVHVTPPPVSLPVIVTGEAPSIAGRKLGHFELIEAVGAGGMAAVLKARDTELSRVVALKILPPEAARDPESITRFKQEARAAAALDHENIARVYFCGEDQGLHFIAFEFVEGINLRQMIDRRGVLPAGECVRYMIQVAAGLNHAAERGVVHRDIKPSNILITPDGRAKIVDMGLARQLGLEAVNGGVTQSGVTLGTFDYISPEQALDPRRADVRSDIYSLGCTFYHALTGRPPVPEGTALNKLRAHQLDEPLDPRVINPLIPDELAAVLAHMMAKDPADRYQTPTELIAYLKGLAARFNLGDAVVNDSATHHIPTQLRVLPEAPRLNPWWVVAGAAVVLAVVAFIVSVGNPGPAHGLVGVSNPIKSKPVDPPVESDNNGPKEPLPTAKDGPVQTAEELAKRLGDKGTTKVTLAARKFDLSELNRAVEFRGEELELVGEPGGRTRIVLPVGTAPSLALKAVKSLIVRNVWFELELDNKEVTSDFVRPQSPLFGLQLEAKQVNLLDCVFVAADDKNLKSYNPRAVSVSAAVRVSAERCLFAPGAVGMAVPAGAQVSASDSGFGPHAAAILIEPAETGPAPRTDVRLDHCSFMLPPGTCAVETAAPANLLVKPSGCLFAPVGGAAVRPDFPVKSDAVGRGVVARVRGDRPDGVRLEAGRLSAYYDTNPVGTSDRTYTFDECKTQIPTVDTKGRVEPKRRPWSEADPLKALADEQPWKAFRLRVESDPGVYTTGEKGRWVPAGVAFHNPAEPGLRRAYPETVAGVWPPTRPLVTENRELVWFPKAEAEDLGSGVYRTLQALLPDVRPGDTVLIRHTGDLPCDKTELKSALKPSEGEFKLTFRAADGCAPVFTVHPDDDADQTMFLLIKGEVTFEGIHFQLRPNLPKTVQVVSAVGVINGRACTFRNCVFTLSEDDDAKAAAVLLPNVDKESAMMTPANRPKPTVTFENCFIRGKGRGVWVAASRPLNLAVTDTLTAIDGPLLLTETGGKVASSATSEAKFDRVTALAGGPLVEMRGGKTVDAMRAAGLVPLKVEADKCLFVAVPGAGKPLVELDAVDPTEWKSVLAWQVKEGNRYANFEEGAELAIIKPTDAPQKEWKRNDWVANTGEPPGADKRFGSVKFATPLTDLKDLPSVKPADAAAKEFEFPDLTAKELGVGADLNKMKKLPLAPDEPKPD